jgi:hypothetical protein
MIKVSIEWKNSKIDLPKENLLMSSFQKSKQHLKVAMSKSPSSTSSSALLFIVPKERPESEKLLLFKTTGSNFDEIKYRKIQVWSLFFFSNFIY